MSSTLTSVDYPAVKAVTEAVFQSLDSKAQSNAYGVCLLVRNALRNVTCSPEFKEKLDQALETVSSSRSLNALGAAMLIMDALDD
jgi:hypothetical protein